MDHLRVLEVVHIVLSGAIVSGLGQAPSANKVQDQHPFHASCQVTWLFPSDCTTVQISLLRYMNLSQNCSGDVQATCRFSNVRTSKITPSGVTITAEFDSDLTMHMEEVTLTLYKPYQNPNSFCTATGHSATKRVFIHQDDGHDFCTLYGLVQGDLAKQDGFEMHTDASICTGYESDGLIGTSPTEYCTRFSNA